MHRATVEHSGFIADLFAQSFQHNGIDRVLGTLRKHLRMDVAFISRFRDVDRVLDHVDGTEHCPVKVGQTIPLEEGYCRKVVLGELPQLIPDTSRVPAAMAMVETHAMPIGAHMGVPILLEDGTVYGTLCCFSHLPDPNLSERDLNMMRAFAEVLAGRIGELRAVNKDKEATVEEIRQAIAGGAPNIVYQPLYAMKTGRLVSVECLSRFNTLPYRPPDKWFAMAQEAGMGGELELLAISKCLSALDKFPDSVSLAVNASPEFVLSGALRELLEPADLRRLTLEVTEHDTVTDYPLLNLALQPLRKRGLRLAIDDAGAGYASMRHILNLQPDSIKLDMSLTRNIDTDPNRRALARALISFAGEIGSCITAEGVETEGELQMLKGLGVQQVQGFYLSKPVSLDMLRPQSVGAPVCGRGFGAPMMMNSMV